MTEHMAQRPSWECRACGKDWPCDPARERLAAEYGADATGLATWLWMRLEEYALDAGPGPLSGAFERFIAWSRPRPHLL